MYIKKICCAESMDVGYRKPLKGQAKGERPKGRKINLRGREEMMLNANTGSEEENTYSSQIF